MARLSHYQEVIVIAGCPAKDAATVEELIRVETPTLDHLTRQQIVRLARKAQADLAWLRENDPECAAFYERTGS